MSPTPPETENPAADFEAAGTPRVAVIGAGITGLSLTHALAERGVESATYEATDEVGGVVQSEKIDGHVLEIGPQRLRLTDAIRAMVTDLDIADELVTAADDLPLLVYADGKLREVPRSPKAFLRTDLLSWQAKLRLLAEPLTSDIDPEEPAERAFVRKFGTETYTNLISPIFGGTYGSDPAQMPAKYALKPIMGLEKRDGNLLRPALSRIFFDDGETPPPATFKSGLQRLPEALAERYEDRVRMETPVTEIERSGDTDGGARSG
jgi:Protoporphyrinogen oxidase